MFPCNLVSSWKFACKDPKFSYNSIPFILTKKKKNKNFHQILNFIKEVKLKIVEKMCRFVQGRLYFLSITWIIKTT